MEHTTHGTEPETLGSTSLAVNTAANPAFLSPLVPDLASAMNAIPGNLRWTQPVGTNIQVASTNQPTAEQLANFVGALLVQPALARLLANARYRVLSAQLIERADKHEPEYWIAAHRVRVVIVDYSNNQTLEATASFPDLADLQVQRSAVQPRPSAEEFEEAVELVQREEVFSTALICGLLIAHRTLPELISNQGPDGSSERVLAVGLRPAPGVDLPYQTVAVNMATQRVSILANGFPDLDAARRQPCGIPWGDCPPPPVSTPGQLWISWPAVNPVWRFLAVRPAASSGKEGSGLEIRYADYKGKRVLYRGHVPVLNVKYDGDACPGSPFRDWQDQEHCFTVYGNLADLAPGFRWSIGVPATACSGSDAGNFTGVALNESTCELILTTEMQAGWYRYIQEWRFHKDGTIRPRFKFTAASHPCVCHPHVHHVYWRLDLDLNTPGNNVVEEYNNPSWSQFNFESQRLRGFGRKWRVRNTSSGEIYELIPGAPDGIAGTYGKADLWVLRYRATEIDDGGQTPGPGGTEAHMDNYVSNMESVANQDVVLWYGAHFRHSPGVQGASECASLGPTLRAVQW